MTLRFGKARTKGSENDPRPPPTSLHVYELIQDPKCGIILLTRLYFHLELPNRSLQDTLQLKFLRIRSLQPQMQRRRTDPVPTSPKMSLSK